jgi:putative phosphoserine phosphatase/1-acylglycerol-3-phosphate O-acyltransferase
LFQTTFEFFGEWGLAMRAVRTQSGVKAGWRVDDIAAMAEKIADELMDQVQPFVRAVLEDHRAAGRTLVLASASNQPTIQALSDRLGFDRVVATRWAVDGDAYTGELDGVRLVGSEKRRAVLAWAQDHDVDLGQSWCYTDSRFDADLLAAVGHPVAVNPDAQLAVVALVRGWPVRHLDKPEGVAKIAGRELQEWLRPLSRPSADPLARIVIEGIDNIPAEGGAVLVFNHRSYYDSAAVGYLISKSGRNGRFLGKKEVFDVPIAGIIAKAMGGIRVDRGTGSDEPLDHAAEALRGGDLIAMAPQGTIPGGAAFFDPELRGRWGAARLATMTGVPVIPVGLSGTEKVWPRSERLPLLPRFGQRRPVVTVTVGKPFKVTGKDLDTATKAIMGRIVALLPAEARLARTPTEQELARTYPPGYHGDPTQEVDRRPGRDI